MSISSNHLSQSYNNQVSSKYSAPVWKISDFYKKSISLIKTNPKLLLLAVAVVIFSSASSGGSSGGGSSSNSPSTTDQDGGQVQQEQIDESQVQNLSRTSKQLEQQNSLNSVGEVSLQDIQDSDETELSPMEEIFSGNISQSNPFLPDWASSILPTFKIMGEAFLQASKQVPEWVYLFFGFQVLGLFIFGIIISFATSAWSQAAMIEGVNQADKQGNNSWNLADVTKHSLTKITKIIWINIIPSLRIILWTFVIILVCVATIGIGAGFIKDNIVVGLALFAVGGFGVFKILTKIIRVACAQVIAKRLIVFSNLKSKEAFNESYKFFETKGHLGKTLSLGISHSFFLGLLIPLLYSLPFIVTIVAFFVSNLDAYQQAEGMELLSVFFSSFTPFWITIILLVGLISILFSVAYSVIVIALKNANWHWAYQYLSFHKQIDL